MRQGKVGEAIDAYRQAIEFFATPKEAALGYFSLGSALSREDKLDEAIDAYHRVTELDPKYYAAGAYINLGVILSEQNKLYGAIDAFRNAIEADPGYAAESAYVNLGRVLRKRGSVEETDSIFQEIERVARVALRQKPDDAKTRNALAQCLNGWAYVLATLLDPEMRDPGRAVSLSQEAVELNPSNGVFWRTLGVAHYRTENWTDARAALEKSRELGFQKSSCFFFLAMAHWQLGEKDKAREWYDKAVEWMEANFKDNAELIRFRTEAEKLLKKGTGDREQETDQR
jgi:tetratricopeptide (TPR) repeat protein